MFQDLIVFSLKNTVHERASEWTTSGRRVNKKMPCYRLVVVVAVAVVTYKYFRFCCEFRDLNTHKKKLFCLSLNFLTNHSVSVEWLWPLNSIIDFLFHRDIKIHAKLFSLTCLPAFLLACLLICYTEIKFLRFVQLIFSLFTLSLNR